MYIPDDFVSMGADARFAIIQGAKASAAEEYPTSSDTGWYIARLLCSVESAAPAEQLKILEQISKRWGI